jgi:hypothetical protein
MYHWYQESAILSLQRDANGSSPAEREALNFIFRTQSIVFIQSPIMYGVV